MKNSIYLFFLGIMVMGTTLTLSSCDILQEFAGESGLSLTSEDVANGLKQALEKGALEGAKSLSKTDGYLVSPYKILLPKEAQQVVSKVSAIPGFNNLETEIVTKINRAAEDAAKAAGPIFVSAIKQMTVRDAWDILRGADNAATNYLQRTTTDKLYRSFQPEIHKSLNKFGALDLWSDVVTRYNSIPFVEKLNPSLDDHITNLAMDGLFSEIAKMEKDIRKDPVKRTTDLMRKVFAQQD